METKAMLAGSASRFNLNRGSLTDPMSAALSKATMRTKPAILSLRTKRAEWPKSAAF
jgi:hypothetical protein